MGWLEDQLDAEYAPWRKSLDDEEVESLLNYEGANHALINGFLRDPDAAAEALPDGAFRVIEEVTARVDAALEKGRLSDVLTCYRGLKSYEALFGSARPEDLAGFEFEERAYCSVSTDLHRALRFAPTDGCLLWLHFAKGTGAAWMPLLEDETYQLQREMLFERGLRFRVENVKRGPDTLVVEAIAL